jgi:hypothetical protein
MCVSLKYMLHEWLIGIRVIAHQKYFVPSLMSDAEAASNATNHLDVSAG